MKKRKNFWIATGRGGLDRGRFFALSQETYRSLKELLQQYFNMQCGPFKTNPKINVW